MTKCTLQEQLIATLERMPREVADDDYDKADGRK
jgi:hypothetical protein